MFGDKVYETIAVKRDVSYDIVRKALNLVKKYIQQNNLILVGGIAIDMALRLAGDKIYEDDSLPDYDFYSTEHHKDAYKIAEWLKKEKMPNVTVINAQHVSTMRVRVNFNVVADVTYVPKNIFDSLPLMRYKGLKLVHPHYQMLDQHHSLCFPFRNPPRETVLSRWKKDMTRYDLLYKYYPLQLPSDSANIKFTERQIGPSDFNVLKKSDRPACITGFLALAYWNMRAREIDTGVTKFIKKDVANSPNFAHFVDNMQMYDVDAKCQVPVDSHGISFYVSKPINDKLVKKKINSDPDTHRFYNKFLDKLPEKEIADNKWEIFYAPHDLISAHVVKSGTLKGFFIANLQNVMMYFLTNYIIFQMKNIDRGLPFYFAYLNCAALIKWASGMLKDIKFKDLFGAASKKMTNKSSEIVSFLPSTSIFGKHNISEAYLNAKRKTFEEIGLIKKEQLQPKEIFANDFIDNKIPAKYYKFSHANSHYFAFDGERILPGRKK